MTALSSSNNECERRCSVALLQCVCFLLLQGELAGFSTQPTFFPRDSCFVFLLLSGVREHAPAFQSGGKPPHSKSTVMSYETRRLLFGSQDAGFFNATLITFFCGIFVLLTHTDSHSESGRHHIKTRVRSRLQRSI